MSNTINIKYKYNNIVNYNNNLLIYYIINHSIDDIIII